MGAEVTEMKKEKINHVKITAQILKQFVVIKNTVRDSKTNPMSHF